MRETGAETDPPSTTTSLYGGWRHGSPSEASPSISVRRSQTTYECVQWKKYLANNGTHTVITTNGTFEGVYQDYEKIFDGPVILPSGENLRLS